MCVIIYFSDFCPTVSKISKLNIVEIPNMEFYTSLHADTDRGTDRHVGINGRFAQLFTNTPRSKYVVKLHFKDTEVPAYGHKA